MPSPLLPGQRLGPYEISAQIGEGGMGLVFRARDSQLGRDVALKVLPEGLTADPERVARFEREAKLLASLNHPNIAQIYGLEQSGRTKALVMELVEGPTLADRLASGALPVDESLSIARQIAEALEEAHERGIVHRDLKPQNIKASIEGKVKVLDFGLAKAMDLTASAPGAPGSGGAGGAETGAVVAHSPALMNSPTLTGLHGTQLGVILGTAAYMSPEQAKGKAVDRRADIWAFGVVLWEMLAGRPLFAADTVAETLGHVMTREPDLSLLPRATPAALRALIARCLMRDPRHRLQAIGDARIALEELASGAGAKPAAAAKHRGAPALAIAGGLLGGVAVTMAILGLAGFLGPASSDPHRGTGRATRRAEIVGLAVTDSSGVAISPDGSEVVGYDVTPSRPALLRRSLDSFEIRRMPGSENGFNPFFAPDGRSIGFFSGEQICVLELAGATRRCLARAQGFATGSWGRDDAIVFSSQTSGEPVSGLWRVPSAGGEAVRLTTVDASRGERAHTYPQRLPDGRNVLLTVLGETQNGVAVVPLAGGTPRTLLANASRGRVVPSGHLIFWDELRGRLTAVAFDPDRLAVTGVPFELGIELNTSSDAVVSFDVSDDGTLVYSLGGMFGGDFTIEIVDRAGQPTPLIAELASWGQPRVSPDGERLLLRRAAQPDCSLWLFDLRRHSLARLGVDGDNHNPLWLAAGESLLSSRQDFGRLDRQVYRVALDGGGPPEGIVVNAGFSAQAESVSPDGRFLALTHDNRRDRNDIYIHDRQSGETRPFLVTEFDEDFPAFSPDGTLLAYAANDSGRNEVYVRPFPGPGGKYLISNQGGTGPVWSRDGRELFYAEGQRLMRVAIERSPRFAASSPQRLFESPDYVWERPRNYDVLPGGSGFVMVRRGAATPATRSLRVVFDWFAELERLAPKGAR